VGYEKHVLLSLRIPASDAYKTPVLANAIAKKTFCQDIGEASWIVLYLLFSAD
jgi:hypothetical protein